MVPASPMMLPAVIEIVFLALRRMSPVCAVPMMFFFAHTRMQSSTLVKRMSRRDMTPMLVPSSSGGASASG